MTAATFRRPRRREPWLGDATVFRTAGLGRRRHTATRVAGSRPAVHNATRAGLAANRSRDPMGRRKSAEIGARGKDQRSIGPSLAPRTARAIAKTLRVSRAARG